MISICMIMKNEEKFIDECLKRLSRYNCEIVIADTGSTDKSIEIAKKYTDKIYHFEWCDDFAAARNFAISKAENDIVLNIDCDEYTENADLKEIERIISDDPDIIGNITLKSFFNTNGIKQISKAYLPRVFNRKKYCYIGKIHELPSKIDGSEVKYANMPFEGIHFGYDGNEDVLKSKAQRNIKLLENELKTDSRNTYTLYQLGKSYYMINDYENAALYFEKCHKLDPDKKLEYVQTMYETYAYALININRNEDAGELLKYYDELAVTADFVFVAGLIYINLGKLSEAVNEFKKALTMKNASIEGVNSYAANYNIGVIYECVGDLKTALSYYEKCGDYLPAAAGIERVKGISKK